MMTSSHSLNVSTHFEDIDEGTKTLHGGVVVVTPDGCTDEMLETVDHCVACVNQIDLQHDFEKTLPTDEDLLIDRRSETLHDLVLEQLCSGAAPVVEEEPNLTTPQDESIEVTADQIDSFTPLQCDIVHKNSHTATLGDKVTEACEPSAHWVTGVDPGCTRLLGRARAGDTGSCQIQ